MSINFSRSSERDSKVMIDGKSYYYNPSNTSWESFRGSQSASLDKRDLDSVRATALDLPEVKDLRARGLVVLYVNGISGFTSPEDPLAGDRFKTLLGCLRWVASNPRLQGLRIEIVLADTRQDAVLPTAEVPFELGHISSLTIRSQAQIETYSYEAAKSSVVTAATTSLDRAVVATTTNARTATLIANLNQHYVCSLGVGGTGSYIIRGCRRVVIKDLMIVGASASSVDSVFTFRDCSEVRLENVAIRNLSITPMSFYNVQKVIASNLISLAIPINFDYARSISLSKCLVVPSSASAVSFRFRALQQCVQYVVMRDCCIVGNGTAGVQATATSLILERVEVYGYISGLLAESCNLQATSCLLYANSVGISAECTFIELIDSVLRGNGIGADMRGCNMSMMRGEISACGPNQALGSGLYLRGGFALLQATKLDSNNVAAAEVRSGASLAIFGLTGNQSGAASVARGFTASAVQPNLGIFTTSL